MSIDTDHCHLCGGEMRHQNSDGRLYRSGVEDNSDSATRSTSSSLQINLDCRIINGPGLKMRALSFWMYLLVTLVSMSTVMSSLSGKFISTTFHTISVFSLSVVYHMKILHTLLSAMRKHFFLFFW